MNYVLYDGQNRKAFLPFTFTRPVCELRIGILTIREKWERYLNKKLSVKTVDYLSEKWPAMTTADNVLIDGSVLPNPALISEIEKLQLGEALSFKGQVFAFRSAEVEVPSDFSRHKIHEYSNTLFKLEHTWELFSKNDEALRDDFQLLTRNRKSQPLSATNQVVQPDQIFLEEGASVEFSILNASTGPIYVGKNAQIMEGNIVRGGLALNEGAVLKMGSKIYGATTLGPFVFVFGVQLGALEKKCGSNSFEPHCLN